MEKGQHGKLRKVVEKLLREDKKCRTDNKILTYKVLRHFTNIFIPFQDFIKIPHFESIARCKRDFMNKEGKFNEKFVPEPGTTYEPKEKIKELT